MMKILLTNDDGIHAPGLYALHEALKNDFEIRIVAPESEMSAIGHAITLSSPLRVHKIYKDGSLFGQAVNGTPADCVKIAVQELLEEPPDIILSGINLGANVGVNVLYSGTVSASTEGAFLGFRSAALSIDYKEDPNFGFAAQFSKEIIRFICEQGLKAGTALNVNIPAVDPEEITGVTITRQGTTRMAERFERRSDPRGNVYYWLTREKAVENDHRENDSSALSEKKITITPIQYDLTCFEELERLKLKAVDRWKVFERDENP